MSTWRWPPARPPVGLGAIAHGPVVLSRAPDVAAGLRCVVTAVAAVALAGCSTPAPTPSTTRYEVALYDGTAGSGMASLLSGTLAVTGGCVTVETADGARVLPVFPRGQVGWDGAVLRSGRQGQEVAAGAPVALGGGLLDADSAYLRGAALHVPAGCSVTGRVFVVTPG